LINVIHSGCNNEKIEKEEDLEDIYISPPKDTLTNNDEISV
jgi:hypothetical protein